MINVIRIIVQIQIYQTQAYQFFSQENLKPLKTPQQNHTFFFFSLPPFRLSQSQETEEQLSPGSIKQNNRNPKRDRDNTNQG